MTALSVMEMELPEPNQLASVSPWDLDFRQLTRGTGRTRVRVCSGQSIEVLSIQTETRIHQSGASPKGVVTLGVPKTGTISKWLGANVPANGLILFGSGDDFEGVTESGFHGTTVSIGTHFLDALSRDFGFKTYDRIMSPGVLDLLSLSGPGRMFVRQASQFLDNQTPSLVSAMEEEIGLLILLATTTAHHREAVTDDRLRDRALVRALEVIDASVDAPPTVREICVQSGASWPTLNRAFAERFGIGPKSYLNNLRLSRARTDLIHAVAGTTVSDVANRWGFWHMGKFAGDYHKLFNRLPSQDLERDN